MRTLITATLLTLALTAQAQPATNLTELQQIVMSATQAMNSGRSMIATAYQGMSRGVSGDPVSATREAHARLKEQYAQLQAIATTDDQKKAVKEWRLEWETFLSYPASSMGSSGTQKEAARANVALRRAFE